MAIKYGVNATKRDNQAIPQLIGPGEVAGRLRVAYDEFTLTADLSSGDIIKMMKLPAGARVVDVVVASADLDVAGGTLDIGWAASSDGVEAADDDGFLANVDVTAAITTAMSDLMENAVGQFKQFSSEVEVQVKIDGDTDATTGTIKLAVLYVTD